MAHEHAVRAACCPVMGHRKSCAGFLARMKRIAGRRTHQVPSVFSATSGDAGHLISRACPFLSPMPAWAIDAAMDVLPVVFLMTFAFVGLCWVLYELLGGVLLSQQRMAAIALTNTHLKHGMGACCICVRAEILASGLPSKRIERSCVNYACHSS